MFNLTKFFAEINLTAPLMVICVGGIVVPLYYLIKAYTCKHWPSAQGKIILSKTRCRVLGKLGGARVLSSSIWYRANIKYIFSVIGFDYTGSQIFLNDGWSGNATKIHVLLNKYPNEKQVTVYYNPNNPGDCVLEVNQPPEYFVWCCGTIVVCSLLLAMLHKI